MGRPSDLTPTLRDKFCKLVAEGHWLKTAAAACNLDESTVYHWIKRGRAGEQPYAEFFDALELANAQVETEALEKIRSASQKPRHWTAAAWLLERRFPERYGHTVRVEAKVRSELRDAMVRLKAGLSAEEFERVLAILADDLGSEGVEG